MIANNLNHRNMYFELIFDNLDKVLSQYDKTIVMYGAEWCNDCVDTKLLFKKLSEKYEDIAFIYSDSDNLNYSRSFVEFETIPTFAVFENDNDNMVVIRDDDRVAGWLSTNTVAKVITIVSSAKTSEEISLKCKALNL